MSKLPIIYIRGYAGPTAGLIHRSTTRSTGSTRAPLTSASTVTATRCIYQFEGPMLRLITDEDYRLLVHGDQGGTSASGARHGAPSLDLGVSVLRPGGDNVRRSAHRKALSIASSTSCTPVSAQGFDIEWRRRDSMTVVLSARKDRCGQGEPRRPLHGRAGGPVHDPEVLPTRGPRRQPATPAASSRSSSLTARRTAGSPSRSARWTGRRKRSVPPGPTSSRLRRCTGTSRRAGVRGDRGGGQIGTRSDRPRCLLREDIFCLVGTDPQDYGLSEAGWARKRRAGADRTRIRPGCQPGLRLQISLRRLRRGELRRGVPEPPAVPLRALGESMSHLIACRVLGRTGRDSGRRTCGSASGASPWS